tara:strand:- start:2332 stop:2490 length:159 start_codon:yes stop_codon:yes gene_type:complete
MEKIISLSLYYLGDISHKIGMKSYDLYEWAMHKSLEFDPNGKVWKHAIKVKE